MKLLISVQISRLGCSSKSGHFSASLDHGNPTPELCTSTPAAAPANSCKYSAIFNNYRQFCVDAQISFSHPHCPIRFLVPWSWSMTTTDHPHHVTKASASNLISRIQDSRLHFPDSWAVQPRWPGWELWRSQSRVSVSQEAISPVLLFSMFGLSWLDTGQRPHCTVKEDKRIGDFAWM